MSCNDDWNYTPAARNLTLLRGGGFERDLVFRDKDNPALPWVIPLGTTVRYVFGNPNDTPIATWTGTIAGSTASFAETPDEDIIRNGIQVRLIVDTPTSPPRVMSIGQVNWR